MKLGLGNTKGFTIVEVMIVLAITAFIFVIAAEATSGQIEKGTFKSGVSQIASAIQNSIEQVEDGTYTDIPLNQCTISATDQVTFLSIGGVKAQGNNSNCIYAGDMFQFDVSGATSDYDKYALAADITCNNGQVLTLYCASSAQPFAGTGIGAIIQTPSVTIQTEVPDNLQISEMGITPIASGASDIRYSTSSTNANVLIGFVENFGLGNGQSGSQGRPYIVYVPAGSSWTTSTAATYINGANLAIANEACIGVSDGKQYADIVVGGKNSDQLSVDIVYVQPGVSNQCN